MPAIEPRIILAVACGAAIGGVARLLLTQLAIARFGGAFAFYATAFINISGSLAIGFVFEAANVRASVDPLWRSFLATGILGGYTTFSTFSLEAFALLGGGRPLLAVGYALGSVVLGVIGCALGIAAARVVL